VIINIDIMQKIVEIEKAPGKVVRTLVDSKDHPEFFCDEVKVEAPKKENIVKKVVKKVTKKTSKKK